jgi:accessory colonization factor AcfC
MIPLQLSGGYLDYPPDSKISLTQENDIDSKRFIQYFTSQDIKRIYGIAVNDY